MATRDDDITARAVCVLAGGATHAARAYTPPLHVTRAQGARKWLVDGREMVDYTMGHGALLLGHAHPAVVEAIREQAGRGTHYGASNEPEVRWAELIVGLVPSVERVRFTASGTEAAMLALRLARATTGRELIVKLDDHFHGWSDAVSVNCDSGGRPVAPPGVPDALARLTRVVPPGDVEALAAALDDRAAAAVIMEASGAHYGRVPLDAAFVAAARRLCDATGTLLVVDEVVTGFRVHPAGMQGRLGVRADLGIYGKIMAGGLPGGAVGGRAGVMELLAAATGPDDRAPHVVHSGTWNANPLSAAAGITTLRLVADGGAQVRAAAFAERLENAWRGAIEESGLAGRVWRLESIVHCALDDPALQARLGNALRDHGVDLLHTSAFCSTAHSGDDLDRSSAAMHAALRDLRG